MLVWLHACVPVCGDRRLCAILRTLAGAPPSASASAASPGALARLLRDADAVAGDMVTFERGVTTAAEGLFKLARCVRVSGVLSLSLSFRWGWRLAADGGECG